MRRKSQEQLVTSNYITGGDWCAFFEKHKQKPSRENGDWLVMLHALLNVADKEIKHNKTEHIKILELHWATKDKAIQLHQIKQSLIKNNLTLLTQLKVAQTDIDAWRQEKAPKSKRKAPKTAKTKSTKTDKKKSTKTPKNKNKNKS